MSADETRALFEELIALGNQDPTNVNQYMVQLKENILKLGIPSDPDTDQKKPTLRGRIWRILLNIGTPDLDEYFDLVQQGPCSKPETAELIHADVNRTFNDGDTNLKLDLNVLERVLHAFQRKHDNDRAKGLVSNALGGYIQGMNTIAAAFILNMSELDAFYCFYSFVTAHSVRYCIAQEVAKASNVVVHLLLKKLDPELYEFLSKKRGLLDEKVGASFVGQVLRSMLTALKPLEEAIKLWDLMLAYGSHLVLFFIVAYIVLKRDEIMQSNTPDEFFIVRKKVPALGQLNAKLVSSLAFQFLLQLPNDILEVCLTYDIDSLV